MSSTTVEFILVDQTKNDQAITSLFTSEDNLWKTIVNCLPEVPDETLYQELVNKGVTVVDDSEGKHHADAFFYVNSEGNWSYVLPGQEAPQDLTEVYPDGSVLYKCSLSEQELVYAWYIKDGVVHRVLYKGSEEELPNIIANTCQTDLGIPGVTFYCIQTSTSTDQESEQESSESSEEQSSSNEENTEESSEQTEETNEQESTQESEEGSEENQESEQESSEESQEETSGESEESQESSEEQTEEQCTCPCDTTTTSQTLMSKIAEKLKDPKVQMGMGVAVAGMALMFAMRHRFRFRLRRRA